MISYTRNFEDVMLVRALRHIADGFYVDIGASHPVSDSNTFALYGLGWRGVAIEPQTIFNDEWSKQRPEDLLVNAVIAQTDGEVTLFKPVDYGQGATINADYVRDYMQRGLAMSEHIVPMHTLTAVLDHLALAGRAASDIHLLSIDVEGAEKDVLRGLDWTRYHPWLVVLEKYSAWCADAELRGLGAIFVGARLRVCLLRCCESLLCFQ